MNNAMPSHARQVTSLRQRYVVADTKLHLNVVHHDKNQFSKWQLQCSVSVDSGLDRPGEQAVVPAFTSASLA